MPFENQNVFIILAKSKSICGRGRAGKKLSFIKLFACF